MNKINRLLVVGMIGASFLTVGCEGVGHKPAAIGDHVPEFFLSHKYNNGSKNLAQGEFYAAGYGCDPNIVVALDKAILEAEVSAAKNMKGHKIKSISKTTVRRNKNLTTLDNKKNQYNRYRLSENNSGKKSVNSFSTTMESTIDTELGPYYIRKKEIFRNKGMYEAYVLISNVKAEELDFDQA